METYPIKILIVDDEEVILEIMARKIASHGYEVTTARDGEEAWEKIERPPDARRRETPRRAP